MSKQAYLPATSRLIGVLHGVFGCALVVIYGVSLLVATGLPLITVGSVTAVLFSISAIIQIVRPPVSRPAVWGFAIADILLFSFLIWSFALLYYGRVPAALGAPTYLFLFPLMILWGFHRDPKLILLTGGIALGARLAMDMIGVVDGGTFTFSYSSALRSAFIAIPSELESLTAICLYTLALAWLVRPGGSLAAAMPPAMQALDRRNTIDPGDDNTVVLVAEDSTVNMMVLSNMLSDKGFTLIMTENGREAIDAFTRACGQGRPPDIVLLDIEMPEVDGLEAAAVIRGIERESGIAPRPIIAVTALGNEENRLASYAAGMDEHLVKPLQKPVLLATMTQVLSRHRRR